MERLTRCFAFVLFLLFGDAIGDTATVSFMKTRVVMDIESATSLQSYFVRSRLECSELCALDYDCRKYLYCPDDTTNTCVLFEDGENCVCSDSNSSKCSCYRKWKQSDGNKCKSPIGYYGNNCQDIIKDCSEGFAQGMRGFKLSYIRPTSSSETFEVLCDFEQNLTTIQMRSEDLLPVNFNRSWQEYVEGFGIKHSEHWIGLEKIKLILENGPFKLDIHVKFLVSTYCTLVYNDFSLDNEYRFYGTLVPSENTCLYYRGLVPLPFYNATPFSTYDHGPRQDCAQNSGWWFGPDMLCSKVNLNSPRYDEQQIPTTTGIYVYGKRAVLVIMRLTKML